MNKIFLKRTIDGLVATAREKICVMGYKDAQDDIQNIKKVYDDFIMFWNLDDDLSFLLPKNCIDYDDYFNKIVYEK